MFHGSRELPQSVTSANEKLNEALGDDQGIQRISYRIRSSDDLRPSANGTGVRVQERLSLLLLLAKGPGALHHPPE